jgi:hypothetical protein
MKTKSPYAFLLLIAALLQFQSCDNKDDPKIIPTVVTSTPTDITTTNAVASGTISSDGNSSVTESGFVYSSNVAQPTTADNKTKSTDTGKTFTAKLTGLTSGTTYHLRAYAINEVGTGYGAVVDFMTGNAAPTASELSIDGTLQVSQTVTAKYKYSDPENDAEGTSTFQWYVANDATGAGEAAIAGATGKTFVIQDAQNGKFLRFSITPNATSGTTSAAEVKSGYSSAVGAETVTFTYNGASVTYGTILSAATGKKWLDRNLGATRVAQSVDDYLAYGHHFQWGRLADGHQVVTRTGTADANATAASGTTATKSTTVTPPNSNFIIDPDYINTDWIETQNDNLWQGVNGVNNPCPTGWRLPTKDEWTAESIASITNAFDKLKLTFTGYRATEDGLFYGSASYGAYWTSTIGSVDNDPKLSYRVRFNSTFFSGATSRGNGYPCRCIKQ